MNEQEAEALAARLTRIWMPKTDWVTQSDWLPQWVIRKGFTYSTKVEPSTRLTYSVGPNPVSDILFLLRRQEGERTGHLSCFIERASVDSARPRASENESLFHQFELEWGDTFRRGCWLSGVPIEASAHEKAEWMQGFTKEEIEAWNLKI